MPQVAFDTKSLAASLQPATRPAAPDRANSGGSHSEPFESLLDAPARERARPSQSEPPARRERPDAARRDDDRSPAATRHTDKPADRTHESRSSDAKASETKPAESKAANGAAATDATTDTKAGAKADAKTGAKAGATSENATATGETAATAGDAAAQAAAAAATATATDAAATVTATPADAAAAAPLAAHIVAHLAAQTAPQIAAPAADATPSAEDAPAQAAAPATGPTGVVLTTLQAKALAPGQADGKPAADAEVSTEAEATAETGEPADPKHQLTAAEIKHAKAQLAAEGHAKLQQTAQPVMAAAEKTSAVAPPPVADAQPSTPTVAPQIQVAPPAAAAAVAPTAPSAPQSSAVPLAGVPVEIAARALEGKNRFEIRLDPAELGRIDVRLDVDRDGKVTARLLVDRPDTLDMLRRDAPNLERALQDAGLKTSGNGLQFSLRDNNADQHHDRGHSDRAHMMAIDETAPAADIIPADYRRPLARAGGLDIQV